MAKEFKTLLVAGMLTMAASSAFADNRQQLAQNAAPQATTQQAATDPNVVTGDYAFISKDGKQVKMSVSFKMLDHGVIPSPQFGQGLIGAGGAPAMQEMMKYKADEFAANIPAMEKAITDGLAKRMMMGVSNGQMNYAKPGVNYGAVTINKITDKDGKVLFEAKKPEPPKAAPTTKPAAGVKNA